MIFLATINLSEVLGGLERLATSINITLLSKAVIRAATNTALFTVQSEPRLWLLTHFIRLHRLQDGTSEEPEYMRAISVLLSSSATEIISRIDIEDSEALHQASGEEEDDGQIYTSPLPSFVKDELVTLVDKRSITGLLAKFNT